MKQFLILILLGGFATATAAQESATEAAPADKQNSTAIGANSSDAALSDRNCLRRTGSLITASRNERKTDEEPHECANVPGRAYTREDIRSTGANTTAEALRLLDPSIR